MSRSSRQAREPLTALRVRRRKLLLSEARSCLSHAPEVLAALEERLGS